VFPFDVFVEEFDVVGLVVIYDEFYNF